MVVEGSWIRYDVFENKCFYKRYLIVKQGCGYFLTRRQPISHSKCVVTV